MEWTDETIAKLRTLWAEGLSTAEIGRRMGVSKNAVVGKAHRLLLASRPSPIRRDPEGQRPARAATPRRVTGSTLPPLASHFALDERTARDPFALPTPPRTPAPEPLAAESPPPARAPRPVLARPFGSERRRDITCCWPLGEPGTRSFRFCDSNSLTGKPYCEQHAALAYVKIRDRREDAA